MRAYLTKHFPSYGVHNVRWFYIVTVLQGAWFQVGNWLLYALMYVSTGTFSMFEAIAFGAGILLEIPSGAFADIFGRKRTVIIGSSLQAVGSLLFTLGFLNNILFFLGNLLIIISFSFRSGAQEALVYDSMKDFGVEEHFDEVMGKARSLVSLSVVFVSIIGGLAWSFSFYAPWTLTTIAFIFGFIASTRYIEPMRQPEIVTINSFLTQNKKGFYYLMHTKLHYFALSFGIMLASFLMWHTGIIRSLMGRDFGYDGQTINYLISVTSLVGFIVAFHFKRIRKKLGDTWGYTSLLFVAGLAWGISSLFNDSLLIGFFVFMGITLSGILGEIWTSVIINKYIHSNDRATALSTLSFLVQIPYVLVVVVFGKLIESGNSPALYAVFALLLFFATCKYIRGAKKAHS